MGGAKSSGESLRKNAFNLWVTVSLTTKNVNDSLFRKRNPGRHNLALRPDRALERLYSNTLDKLHSLTSKQAKYLLLVTVECSGMGGTGSQGLGNP